MEYMKSLKEWAERKVLMLFIFNIILMMLILLHNAGYFAPYFPITINIIIFLSLIFSIVLLNLNSKILFTIAVLFWVFAGLLKILGIDIWAERTVIYAFETIFIGTLLHIYEGIRSKKILEL